MIKNKSALATIAIVGGILSSPNALASAAPSENDLKAAELMATLIEKGHLKLNPKSGKLMIETSVLQLLVEAGLVKDVAPDEIELSSGCNSTVGTMC